MIELIEGIQGNGVIISQGNLVNGAPIGLHFQLFVCLSLAIFTMHH